MKKLITQKEFLKRTGMSKSTCRLYAAKGRIATDPPVKVKGMRTLYFASEVAKWKK